MDLIKLTLFLVIFCIELVFGDELCYAYSDGFFFCEYGCCGSYGYEYCCGVYSWIIAVSVVGAIIIISVVVVIVCVCLKKKSATGRVINPAGGQTQTIQTVHVPPPAYNQQPQFQPQPQQYPPPQYPAPGQNPAYPPPPPAQYY